MDVFVPFFILVENKNDRHADHLVKPGQVSSDQCE